MKIRGSFFFMLCSVLFSSCAEKEITYEYLLVRDGRIKIWTDTIPEGSLSNWENAAWTIQSEEGRPLMKGKLQHGFKAGEWNYYPADTQMVNVYWRKFAKEDYSVEINYPDQWTVVDVDRRPFQATFRTESPNKEDKFFIIFPHRKDSIGMDLKQYWQHYSSIAFKEENVKSYLALELQREDESYYYSEYTLKRNEEELLVINFLGEVDSMIYDITYSSLNEEVAKKQIIFFEMIRSLVLPGRHRFFTPIGKQTKVFEIDYPGRSQIAS